MKKNGVRPRAYLAGPTVFFPEPSRHGAALVALCDSHGLAGVFPLDDLHSPAAPSASEIFEHNLALLRTCDLVIADISPFRGPHADDGTAFEMGFAHALAMPIFAYSSDCRPLAQRIAAAPSSDARLRDKAGLEIENFGKPQNLMLSCASVSIHESPLAAVVAAAAFFHKYTTVD
jgi:nucleoside 2-deoxyribosyltransferase